MINNNKNEQKNIALVLKMDFVHAQLNKNNNKSGLGTCAYSSRKSVYINFKDVKLFFSSTLLFSKIHENKFVLHCIASLAF